MPCNSATCAIAGGLERLFPSIICQSHVVNAVHEQTSVTCQIDVQQITHERTSDHCQAG